MTEDKEQKTYEVKDKRRVNPDGTLKESEEDKPRQEQAAETQQEQPAEKAEDSSSAAEAPPTEQGSTTEAREQVPPAPPNIYAMLEFVVGLLTEQAWQLMGIRLAPGQKEMTTDLAQAKVAIDTIVLIADKLHPHVGEEDRRALRGLISDLQVNYVQRSQSGGGR